MATQSYFLLTVLMLSLSALSTDALGKFIYTCDPANDCSLGEVGEKVPDPYDCFNYYLCIDGGSQNIIPSTLPTTCPNGYYFDQGEQDCVLGETCQDLCLNTCRTECELDLQYLIYPGDCNKYYVCINLIPEVTSCAVGEYFAGTGCSTNPGDCCDNCTPFCNMVYTEVADPSNCNGYYICLEEGIPTNLTKYVCPDRMSFDSTEGRCVSKSCSTLCEFSRSK